MTESNITLQTGDAVLTTFDHEDYVYKGIRAGAVGYLLKDAAPDELVDAVRAAYRGEAIYRTAGGRPHTGGCLCQS